MCLVSCFSAVLFHLFSGFTLCVDMVEVVVEALKLIFVSLFLVPVPVPYMNQSAVFAGLVLADLVLVCVQKLPTRC